MTIPNALKLLEDSIEFKFYAADYHLKYLKDLEAKGMTPHDPTVRIEREIIPENLLFHTNNKDSFIFQAGFSCSFVSIFCCCVGDCSQFRVSTLFIVAF
jgi:hypothetical protein